MFKVLVFLVFQFSFYNAFPLCKSQMSRVQLVEEMNRIIDLMDAMKGGADVKIDSVSFSPARRKLYWNLFWDQIDCLGRILEFKGSSVV
jgi:hypothetical protein